MGNQCLLKGQQPHQSDASDLRKIKHRRNQSAAQIGQQQIVPGCEKSLQLINKESFIKTFETNDLARSFSYESSMCGDIESNSERQSRLSKEALITKTQ